MTAQRTTASTSVFLTTFGLILASIVALLVVDLWLARIDARESRVHALHLYEDGESLLARSQPTEAADRFASAQALQRSDVRYGVALAEALLADGRVRDAEAQLRSVLDRAETDGAANLVMARILAREGRLDEAVAYYHRAIYGGWPADSSARALRARLELIDLLARRSAGRGLLAELLPLQDADPDSVALRRRLGHLFVLAGSPERALPLFRELLKRDPDDGDAYAGMGEAALLLGNFRTARADLAIATRLIPDSSRFASVLQLADTVLALDPLARGIGGAARRERARRVLQLSAEAMTTCGRGTLSPQLADSVRVLLGAHDGASSSGGADDADALLDLASELWSRRDVSCSSGQSAAMRALALIQKKLA
ncbi:MAG TPA: tetratricopeptide repeat protein [Gemmatimonadaceae bacterium]|nr:tetratricopeptide repeat protein [Gemmatimonadaceae bacterium]